MLIVKLKETVNMKKTVFFLSLILILIGSLVIEIKVVIPNSDTPYPLASGIFVNSPLNKTYTQQIISLNVSINMISASNIHVLMKYSLDGQANQTIPSITNTFNGSFQAIIEGSVVFPVISYGKHNVTVFAEHKVNNELVHSDKKIVYFTISDTIPPQELIPPKFANLSIENKTYNSTELLLSFNIDKTALWIGYSLDNQGNRTIAFFHDLERLGNQVNKTLKELTEGTHTIVVYANNTQEKTGASEIIYFSVSTNSEQEIPEFPSWSPVLVGMVALVSMMTVYRKKLKKLRG